MQKSYIVVSGDTLYGISNQFGVSVDEIKRLNNLKNNIIQIGQILKIPINEGTNPNSTFMYTVKKNDTLYSIASRYKTTVDEIKRINNLTNNNLQINQQLLIPEMYSNNEKELPNYINYTVKKGDTLYSIAKNNNLDVDTIITDNNLTSNNLKIGQNLKIRTIEVEECFGNNYVENKTYTVKKGDTIYSNAKKYNITVNDLNQKNNLKTNIISVGQVLFV